MNPSLESVTISGTAQEGETLTASTSPAGATVSYKWMQGIDSSYTPISSATGKTYVLANEQVGKTVLCECTATGGYTGTQQSKPTAVVKAKPMPVTAVSIAGTAKVGETLTANVTPAAATITYQWQQATNSQSDFTSISGATGKTYVLKEAENGKVIKVIATGTGAYTGKAESAATAAVQPADGS